MLELDRLLLRHFLPKLLGRACPSTVHRSGEEGQKVNCFSTFIRDGDEPNLVLLSMQGADIEALRYDGNSYSISTTVPLNSVDPEEIRVTHFYGIDEVRYTGISAVALGFWTHWPYMRIHLQRFGNAIAQRLFNRRTLEVRRRLDILRDVVNATLGGADAVDALDLMSAWHGDRWAGHPGWEAHHNLLERHLELLVHSGELTKHDHRYRPTGLALKTLDESEEGDRKHSANLRVQLLLVFLTFVLAVMAAAQAGLLKLPTLVDLTGKAPMAASTPAASLSASRGMAARAPR